MCLICEQEDLYFLYLARLERAQQAARGKTSPADPNWLWPDLVASASADAAAETAAPRRPDAKPGFACDSPGE